MAGYIGARSVSLSATVANAQDVTATDTTPEVTIVNNTHEDSDGGREGKLIFKGQQSGGEESTLAEIEANHSGSSDDEKGQLIIRTNDGSDGASPTEAMRIESDQQVLITTSADAKGLTIKNSGNNRPYLNMDANRSGAGNNLAQMNFKWNGTDVARIIAVAGADTTNKDDAHITFGTASAGSVNEAMRIDNSQNLLVGTTDVDIRSSSSVEGMVYRNGLSLDVSMDGGNPLNLNRLSSDGNIIEFRKDGSTAGYIGTGNGGDIYIGNSGTGFMFAGGSNAIIPTNQTALRNDAIDLGHPSYAFDDIYATNTSIQTSDENEKQNIASLTNAEITAATAISKLFKTFKWKSKVTAKGDDARTHTGVIAQQVQTAMSDAGLDASKYAFWCSNTWWTKDGNHYDIKDEAPEGATEHTRMGIRYAELLAFVCAATEQRLTSIESRLTALEAE